jgi:polysaccharide export outer membrane protein
LILSEAGAYLTGYTINDSGYITLPVVGKVLVLNKTMEEATSEIENKSALYLKDVTVVVKLLSYKFTVIGEVRSPGNYYNYNNQLSVLDAIGMAGDITEFGDRSKVLVVRSLKGGSHTYRFNLHKKDILSSEGYFLVPNDIVIVEPLKSKWIQVNAPTVNFILGTIVSTLSLTLLVITVTQ